MLAAPAYAFAATFALLKLIGLVWPLRATADEEALGLDIVSHGEEAYPTGEGTILVEPIRTSIPVGLGRGRRSRPRRRRSASSVLGLLRIAGQTEQIIHFGSARCARQPR